MPVQKYLSLGRCQKPIKEKLFDRTLVIKSHLSVA